MTTSADSALSFDDLPNSVGRTFGPTDWLTIEQSRIDQFAEATGVQLLIPHMGVGLGSEFLRQKAWGPGRVATESCPHYLAFEKDTDRGVQGKVNPPLRSRDHVEALWHRLADGTIDVMDSDHCPYTKAVKGDDLWTARAGISG